MVLVISLSNKKQSREWKSPAFLLQKTTGQVSSIVKRCWSVFIYYKMIKNCVKALLENVWCRNPGDWHYHHHHYLCTRLSVFVSPAQHQDAFTDSPYLLDLASRDFFLFFGLKSNLKGGHFANITKVKPDFTTALNNIKRWISKGLPTVV